MPMERLFSFVLTGRYRLEDAYFSAVLPAKAVSAEENLLCSRYLLPEDLLSHILRSTYG